MPYCNGRHMSSMEYDSLFHAGLVKSVHFGSDNKKHRLRARGTAVVFRDDKVLLVRDKGKNDFSLPGGGVEDNEPSLAAAVRELYEELGMSARMAERVFSCDFDGTTNRHKVSLIETDDEPRLRGSELVEFIWWNGKDMVARCHHVDKILAAVHLHVKGLK